MMKKRFLSAALALMMLFTLLPVNVFAADAPEPTDAAPTDVEPTDAAPTDAAPTNEPEGDHDFVFVPGVIPEEVELIYPELPKPDEAASNLPASYDARQYQSPIRNQGGQGLCWTFGTYGALEAYMNQHGIGGGSNDFSELHMAYSTSNANGNSKEGFDRAVDAGGNRWKSAAYLMRSTGLNGTVDESLLPYVPYGTLGSKNLTSLRNMQKGYTVQNILFLTGEGNPTEAERAEIKKYIMSQGGVGMSMYYDDAYFNDETNGFYCNDDLDGATNHLVEVVGWDDNYSKDNFLVDPGSNGAWLVRNSWGDWWGSDGYCWISYEDTCAPSYTFTIDGVKACDDSLQVYETDYLSDWWTSFDNPTVYVGRGYKTESKYETVKSVRVLVQAPATVEIGVTTNPGSYTFTPLALKDCQYPGWYTIDIPEGNSPVFPKAGTQFAVMVKFSRNSYNSGKLMIGFDHDNSLDGTKAYLSGNGSSWDTWNKNLCIKAVTEQGPMPEQEPVTLAAGTPEVIEGEGTVKLNNPEKAAIYYTLDGSNPASSSTRTAYNATRGIFLNPDTPRTGDTITLKVYAEKEDYKPFSGTFTFTYAPYPPLSAPVITVDGSQPGKAKVTMTITAEADKGAAIYYTLDGTTPTSGSKKYGSPITLTKNTTVKAIAVKAKRDNSPVAEQECTVKVIAPTATPSPSKEFKVKATVKLACATRGATIMYSLNGAAEAEYDAKAGILLEHDATITAYAKMDGMANSDSVTFTYTKYREPAAKPVANPKSGTFMGTKEVTLTSTSGSTIYYTTDGQDPTEASKSVMSGGTITLGKDDANEKGQIILKAFTAAAEDNSGPSAVVTFKYTRKRPTAEKPVLAAPGPVKAGTFTTPTLTVYLSCATEDASIYYTDNGKDPLKVKDTDDFKLYNPETGIVLTDTTTIKAIAAGMDMNESKTVTFKFTKKVAPLPTPTLAEPGPVKAGTFPGGTYTVYLNCVAPEGASVKIYYTVDGKTDPAKVGIEDERVHEYTGGISFTETTTIKAFAVDENLAYGKSKTASFKFTRKATALPAPKLVAPGPVKAGTFTTVEQTVYLACNTTAPNVTIYYTTDGTDPTKSETRQVYSDGITLTDTTTIKAYAADAEYIYNNSKVVTFKFTQKLPVAAAPVIQIIEGKATYNPLGTEVKVRLTTKTEGARIIFTFDGTDPLTSETAEVLSEEEIIGLFRENGDAGTIILKAVAVGEGLTPSKVITKKFTWK